MADLSYTDLSDYCDLQEAYIAGAGQRFINTQIRMIRAKIYDRLRVRYDVDAMKLAEPDTVKRWIGELIAPKVYRKRGIDPTDAVYTEFLRVAEAAEAEITAAADSVTGLYQLPLSSSNESSAATKPKIASSSDADPGAWKRRQALRARRERC